MRKAKMKKAAPVKFNTDEKVSHQGNLWEVVGMVGPGLVRISRPGVTGKVVRVNQVKHEESAR